MPLTPLHLGPSLLIYVLFKRFFNLFAILLGGCIMDIEPLFFFIINIINHCYQCPDHFFFHSILGAIIGSIILTIIFKKFKIGQPLHFINLFFSFFIGWIIHIFFDSLTHFDLRPFWPLKYNPFIIGPEIYMSLNLILFVIGISALILLLYQKTKSKL